jgi:hypothetical protein
MNAAKSTLTLFLVAASVCAPAYAQWYTGGTLHKATVQQWNDRGYEGYNDKLATSSDWYVTIVGESKVAATGSMEKIKPKVRELMSCVDNTAYEMSGAAARNTSVASLAANCAYSLGLQ